MMLLNTEKRKKGIALKEYVESEESSLSKLQRILVKLARHSEEFKLLDQKELWILYTLYKRKERWNFTMPTVYTDL